MSGCCCCGNEERPLHKLPTHIGTLGACAPCIAKHGLTNLSNEADRILSIYQAKHEPKCLGCGSQILQLPNGHYPTLCGACLQRGKEIMRESKVAGI